MATFWVVLYVLVLVSFFIVAVPWARRKSRDFKKIRQPSAGQEFFFRPLPRNWYVSVDFCIGLVISALLGTWLLKLIFF
jgi:hypothetical protein